MAAQLGAAWRRQTSIPTDRHYRSRVRGGIWRNVPRSAMFCVDRDNPRIERDCFGHRVPTTKEALVRQWLARHPETHRGMTPRQFNQHVDALVERM